MAQYQHLPIFKTAYDLLIELMQTTKDFPREFKYSVGEKIQTNVVELIVEIYKANSAKDKLLFIDNVLEKIQFINLFLRISLDLKILPVTKYAAFIEKSASIAKQAQGWKLALIPPKNPPLTQHPEGLSTCDL